MPDEFPRMLRSDAQDNRDRIVEAARSLFAERGVDVTMREVARRARVGPATLYRRFATKQLLINEAFARELRACRRIVVHGRSDPDAWRGFCSVVQRLSMLNTKNQGFVDAFMPTNTEIDVFARHRAELLAMLTDLMTRAQASGTLRHDVAIDDIVLVLLACRGLSSTPPKHRTTAARRFAALAIDAFSASETNAALPRPARLAVPAIRGDLGS